ncbi:unnamed protein product [Eruca vesicaria subsp. sativa]|uniref:KIB1-4 beta-propeller domain-containing protein n=1 Tax=Eruca vesicaria subsp. sativa TaxID=29727 RepID=A0ABC8LIY9_ERUVS|nr:unnamed protein product [Eruca vesicaria subsp. sativa]
MVVTVSGDVLLVTSMLNGYGVWLCEIYGMNSLTHEWEKVVSLGDEAMVLDLGITVNAQGINRNSIYSAHDIRGIDRNSIYFSGLGRDENLTFIFHLETNKFERPYHSVSSSIHNCTARWFFPNFSRKRLI